MNQNIEAPTLGLGRLLSEGNRFLVPHHQRDYSWTEDELSQYFSDIAESQAGGQGYYFLGLMVFIPADAGDFTILDGQQRMATTVIALSAVRHWLRGHGINRDADQIQSDFIARRELGEDDLTPRLVLNEVNNHHFESYVINERPTTDVEQELTKLRRFDPNRTLLEAIVFCREEIGKMAAAAKGPKSGAKRLYEFVNYLRDNIRVVRLTVPSEADAYTVFETLNDRGLDLTVLDLVKNHIFGKAGSRTKLAELKNRWAQMSATLSNARGDDFLKAYWTSRHGRTQKAQLFPQIKEQHKTPPSVAGFSLDLLTTSEHYAALESADDPHWSGFSETSRERIRVLRMLRSQSIHPVLLSAMAKFPHREMERLLWLLEVLIVRYQLVGGGRTGLLEIAAARLAADIYQENVSSTSGAFLALKDIYPSDEDFRDKFATKQERNNTKVQYLLRRLEEAYRKKRLATAPDELEPHAALTVEHIFPRNPGDQWDDLERLDSAFAEECTYRLGNLTLLSNINKSLGQKSFDKKRKCYAESSLLITKELAEVTDWNRAAVNQRQQKMASLAAAVWRFQ